MKTHTSAFKTAIKEYGRELDSIITYKDNNDETITLGQEELNSINCAYEGSILKSIMKQLIIDSNVEIPIGTDLQLRFGVKISDYTQTEDTTYQENKSYYSYVEVEEDEYEYVLLVAGTDYNIGDSITGTVYEEVPNYEYINFGHYIVKEVEKREDTQSYEIKCYDKMLYAMQDYEKLDITYPITIRNYVNAIATELGLTFKNASDTFANYDKEIQNELFLSKETRVIEEEGQEPREEEFYSSLGYTYRDVLDQLAEVTASTICINEADDELEVRYITNTNDTIDEEYLKNININFGEKYGKINSIVLSRNDSDNVYLQNEQSVETDGLCEIKILDNQIMNFDDRDTYLTDILNQLDGLEYYINDFSSTGICYYNLCDRYSISIDNNTYSCVMFNDEINITQGLEENIHTDTPESSETDYTKADKTDIKLNKTMLLVDKQNSEITALVQKVNEQDGTLNSLKETTTDKEKVISIIQEQVANGVVNNVKTETIKIDNNGINVSTDNSNISTQITNDQFQITTDNGETVLAYFGYVKDEGLKSEIDNLTVPNYFDTGVHRFKKWTTPDNPSEVRTGIFYIGE